jgi:hypothetical protein
MRHKALNYFQFFAPAYDGANLNGSAEEAYVIGSQGLFHDFSRSGHKSGFSPLLFEHDPL